MTSPSQTGSSRFRYSIASSLCERRIVRDDTK
jgi:hypothetical protein